MKRVSFLKEAMALADRGKNGRKNQTDIDVTRSPNTVSGLGRQAVIVAVTRGTNTTARAKKTKKSIIETTERGVRREPSKKQHFPVMLLLPI